MIYKQDSLHTDTTDFGRDTNVDLCAKLQSKSLLQLNVHFNHSSDPQADHNFDVFFFSSSGPGKCAELNVTQTPSQRAAPPALSPCALVLPWQFSPGPFLSSCTRAVFVSTLEMLQAARSCPGIWVQPWMPPRRKLLHGHSIAWPYQKGLPRSRWTSGSTTGSAAVLGVEE